MDNPHLNAAPSSGQTQAQGKGSKCRSKILERYLDCARRGLTRKETAIELGRSRAAVDTIASAYGIRFGPYRQALKHPAIRAAAVEAYGKESAAAVGRRLGVTRAVIIGHWYRARQAGLLP